MYFNRVFLFTTFLLIFSSCFYSEENPEVLFTNLLAQYAKSEVEYKTPENNLDDGVSITLFDTNSSISLDSFRGMTLLATMGQTEYFCYKKKGQPYWLIRKESIIYDQPYSLDNASFEYTYFKFNNDSVWVFNNESSEYDIKKDTSEFKAVVDVSSIKKLIELISNY